MIKNYFKIAWRTLLKNKVFTLINVTGLSLGVAACILISVYVIHETSYDKFVPNAGNIYRLNNSFNDDGNTRKGIHFSANAAKTIQADFDEIELAGRFMDHDLFYGAGTNEVQFGDEVMQHHEGGFTYADQSIIDIFSIPMVYGNAATALVTPKTIVVTESISKKYFKDKNPVGEIMYLNGNREEPFIINGVMRDFPTNSHLDYKFLVTLTDVEFGEGEQERWHQQNYFTYIQLAPKVDVKTFEKTLSNTLILKYVKPSMLAAGFTVAENLEEKAGVLLQPMTDIQLHSANIAYEVGTRNDIKIIWVFATVAFFILLLASINFVNLSTAKSANRAKEVGLRKVVGSSRRNLIGQFLTESTLVTIISFAIGVFLAQLLMPFFQQMVDIELSMPWGNLFFIPIVLLAAVVVGAFAGFYPSVYLSGFNPVDVLKGKLRMGAKSGGLRSGLVVFQFTISIMLIIGTLIINDQMSFILNSKVGYDRQQVIQLYGTNMLGDKDVTFKKEIAALPDVEVVSISDFLPIVDTKRNGNSYVNEGRDNIDETVPGQAWVIDEDYLETFGLKLIEGTNFGENVASEQDQAAAIINETLAKKLNLENPVGKKISRGGRLITVIGVVKDFRYDNILEDVQSLALFYGKSNTIISVKANTEDMPALLKTLEAKWKTFVPNLAFRYEFMDNSYAKTYALVSRIQAIFTAFTILTILVACLGLFALSAYMIEQRNKEMSIRKVLGASMQNIFQLLTKNFLLLVVIALIIAVPIAYYLMEKWLQAYPNRSEISWSTFIIAGVSAIGIALLTVSYHAIKSALVNPVKNLKGE